MLTMKPIININGMTRREHIELRMDVRQKLKAAIEALSQIRPHGRDYLGDNVKLDIDLMIHNQRQAMLNELYNTLETEALAIQEGE